MNLAVQAALEIYLVCINIVTFTLYGIDKRRAIKQRWRIPERTLLLLPLIGGSVGGLLGMAVFRHKTRHWYFRIGLPVMFFAQAALGVYLAAR